MKLKLVSISLSICLGISTLGSVPIITHANEQTEPSNFNLQNSDFEIVVNKLEKYLVKKADGTIYLDINYKDENLANEYVIGILNWMEVLNESIEAGEIVVDNNFTISFTNELNNKAYEIFSSGKNGFEVEWWGYKIFLDNENTETWIKAIENGRDTGALITIIANMLPSPPTKLASGIAALVVFGMNKGANYIKDTNKGKGVYIRFTWPALVTGIFGQ